MPLSNLPARTLAVGSGLLRLPVFLPDATLGVVRTVDSADLEACQVEGVVMNTFHLMQRPGSSTIQSLGGLHQMSAWPGPLITDSGGFQAYSLIHQNPKFGRLSEKGITFQPEGSDRRYQLTPEKSVQLQLGYDSDVVICLDDCTHVDAPLEDQKEAVRRTIDWARRGKKEYERILAQRKPGAKARPLMFAVIQGGGVLELRRQCAEALLEIGFDGFGFGGWPLDGKGRLLEEIIGYTRQIVPAQFPMHALGVGHPENLLACWRIGYGLFDSAMPTRDARHARLYAFKPGGSALTGKWMEYVYPGDEKHIKAARPVDPDCDGICCRRYSLGFLHHLFKINDALFLRLATIHNLRFMTRLTGLIREGGL